MPVEFEIAPGKYVGGSNPCFIIAEIGQNHQGDMQIAEKLILAAKECGVDCVKFQKSNLACRFTQEVLNKAYNSQNSWGTTYGLHRKFTEFTEENFIYLQQYSTSLGLHFTASGMDKNSIDFLYRLNVPFFKIGSADCTNLPLLKHASKYQKPLVVSTGMNCLESILKMYNEIIQVQKSFAILQCTSSYPTADNEVNLNVLKTYQEKFPEAVIGYSGHEIGTEISAAAIALGAKILERHITLDHALKGSDHAASLNPEEMKKLVAAVRRVEAAMGSYDKHLQPSEEACFNKLGKTVVACKFIPRGTLVEENMIDVKVACTKGWNPINLDDLLGRKLVKDYHVDESIMPNDVI